MEGLIFGILRYFVKVEGALIVSDHFYVFHTRLITRKNLITMG